MTRHEDTSIAVLHASPGDRPAFGLVQGDDLCHAHIGLEPWFPITQGAPPKYRVDVHGVGFRGVTCRQRNNAGMVIVCDGSEDAARRIGRVLWNDPATGVICHSDAGYDSAIDCTSEFGLNMPSLD